ncbi:MAG TPA: DUF4258 domain-containing protein, partial [Polyangiaceae bacterium]
PGQNPYKWRDPYGRFGMEDVNNGLFWLEDNGYLEGAQNAALLTSAVAATIATGGLAGQALGLGTLEGALAWGGASAAGIAGNFAQATVGAGAAVLGGAKGCAAGGGPGTREATGFLGSRGSPLANAAFQPLRNADAIIGGRTFGGHALDQMQNRGITPSVIENAIQNGLRSADPIVGRLRFFDPVNKVTVITEAERVVTVIPGRLR